MHRKSRYIFCSHNYFISGLSVRLATVVRQVTTDIYPRANVSIINQFCVLTSPFAGHISRHNFCTIHNMLSTNRTRAREKGSSHARAQRTSSSRSPRATRYREHGTATCFPPIPEPHREPCARNRASISGRSRAAQTSVRTRKSSNYKSITGLQSHWRAASLSSPAFGKHWTLSYHGRVKFRTHSKNSVTTTYSLCMAARKKYSQRRQRQTTSLTHRG